MSSYTCTLCGRSYTKFGHAMDCCRPPEGKKLKDIIQEVLHILIDNPEDKNHRFKQLLADLQGIK